MSQLLERLRASSRTAFWVAVMLTGVGAGVGGAALTLLLHLVQHLAYGYTEDTFLIGVERASGLRRVLAMALAGLIAGLGWWMLRRYAPPTPSVSETMEHSTRRLPYSALSIDAILQIVIVALGASLGREGAPRQIGSAAGGWLSQYARLPADEARILLACGAGAGLAAVYNVPLGGALFTLEVLLASAGIRQIGAAVITSGLATVVAWAVLPNRPTYLVSGSSIATSVVVWALVAGAVIGLAGNAFIRLTNYAAEHSAHGRSLLFTPLLVFTSLGALAVAYPQLLGNGKGPAQLSFDGTLSWATLAPLVILKPLATAACLGSGAKGGRLTPAVATGALLGAVMGKAWILVWPGARIQDFAIVAAAAFLAVTMRAPITATVLIFEFTHASLGLLLPAVLAVAIATASTRRIDGSRQSTETD